MMARRTVVSLFVILMIGSVPLAAKGKKSVSDEFDASATQVYDAVYRYAQHNGTIKWADEKRMTLSGVIFVPGGRWDWQKHFDCTISVEPTDGGKKSLVDIVGTYPASQQSLVGAFREGPATKVLRGIREEFDKSVEQSNTSHEVGQEKGDTPGR